MKKKFPGWSLWITGAGSGIGAAMARRFAAEGATVALTGRSAGPLEELAAEIAAAGGRACVRPCDVLDREGMLALGARIAAEEGRIDVLCSNAGLNNPNRRWDQIDFAEWDAVLDVNVKGAINAVAAALPAMRAQKGGTIIHTSSWAGRFHSPVSGAPYGAAKHAVSDLSASLNSMEGAHGIRSCALQPAEVNTPLMARRPGYDPELAAAMIQPEDLAEAAVFVAGMQPGIAVHEITVAPIRR